MVSERESHTGISRLRRIWAYKEPFPNEWNSKWRVGQKKGITYPKFPRQEAWQIESQDAGVKLT